MKINYIAQPKWHFVRVGNFQKIGRKILAKRLFQPRNIT